MLLESFRWRCPQCGEWDSFV
ncbi:MAG: hypothetical protein ACE5FG_14875 [Myxococcota bacterium]